MEKVEIQVADRKSAVLTPSQLPCLESVPTINLTSGCAHGCLYCYGRSYSHYPGEGKVILYGNTLEKLEKEFRRKRVTPARVYFSPSTDIFQPIPDLLKLVYDIFDFLLAQEVGIVFVSKGVIPPEHRALLAAHPEKVRAQIGLITLDPDIIQIFEPRCAAGAVRLRQMEQLIQAGIETEARLDPILPGVTDDTEMLHTLFRALSPLGVRHIALNLLYLRPRLFDVLREKIADKCLRDRLLRRYDAGKRISLCNGRFSQIALPREERREILEKVARLAQEHGIHSRFCGCMNPDITDDRCNLTGHWPPTPCRNEQLRLL